MFKKIKVHYGAHFLAYEFTLPAMVVIAVVYLPWLAKMRNMIQSMLTGSRGLLYGTMAGLYGSLLGFGIAALAFVLATIGDSPLETLRKSKHFKDLWKVFTSGVRWLGFSCAFSLLAMVTDRDNGPPGVMFCLLVFCSLVAALRVGRMIWIMEQLISIKAGTDGR